MTIEIRGPGGSQRVEKLTASLHGQIITLVGTEAGFTVIEDW